jgi:hypothetical protein
MRTLEAIIKELRLRPGPAVDLDYRPEDWGLLPVWGHEVHSSSRPKRRRVAS